MTRMIVHHYDTRSCRVCLGNQSVHWCGCRYMYSSMRGHYGSSVGDKTQSCQSSDLSWQLHVDNVARVSSVCIAS
jgi:hypothetical protein